MGNTISTPPRPRWRNRRRRHVFLGLLLLALIAPAGWATAGESSQPYIVIFDPAAVGTRAPVDTDPGAAQSFARAAQPEALQSALARAARPTGATGPLELDGERVFEQVRELSVRGHLRITSVFSTALGGFAAQLTSSQVRTLSANPAVASIVPDVAVELDDGATAKEAGSVRTTGNPSTRVPPGIRRVGARSSRVMAFTGAGARVDADVAILDTGIERNHPDLNVVGGYNCTSANRTKWDDANGHGTHVAGIVGALDNRIGVVGVAPGARLWSVKVLDGNGKGFLSWIVCGIDWVTSQRHRGVPSRPLFEVANMSLSFSLPGSNDRDCGRPSGDSIHQAICRSVSKGTVYVAAAGNKSQNARRYRPGAYDEVITVSAMADYDGRGGGRGRSSDSCPYWSAEPDDSFAEFSNYGPDVDLIAPGKCVLSTYPGKRYAWMSGTSMAAPHVAGAAAIYRSMYPRATPSQVRQALRAVGTLDWKTRSDPDRSAHEKALFIGSFRAMPDFGMRVASSSVSAELGSKASFSVTLDRVGGFEDPIDVSLVDPPVGLSAGPATVRGSTVTLEIQVNRRALPGRYTLEVVARSGDIERRSTIQVAVQSGSDHAEFVSPRAGLTVQSNNVVFVSWKEPSATDITARRIERQIGRIRTPGTCDDVLYTTDVIRTRDGDSTDRTRPGYCYRWRLELGLRGGQRTSVTSGSVLVDASAPHGPSVELAGATISVDLDELGVEEAHVGHGGTLWVRGGVSGSVDLDVSATDRESGIAAYEAGLRGGSGWRTRWMGDSSEGALRLYYAARGSAADLRVHAINGAGQASPATFGRLVRDNSRPRAVEWQSAPSGTRRTTFAPSFRLEWTAGSDADSGLAQQHIVRRYRTPLRSDGSFARNRFEADGPFRLMADGTLDTGLQPGYAYVWSVRTLDNVGNYAESVVSGYVVVTARS